MTADKRYLDFAIKWANDNNWNYSSNGKSGHPSFENADCQLCAETYFQILDEAPDCGGTDELIKAGMEACLKDPRTNYWWWVDTIYMALPFYHIYGVRYNEPRCFEKAHGLFTDSRTNRTCYDEVEHMWYRDENYLPFIKLSPAGKKIFWGRGQGWVLGGLARTLEHCPKDVKYYDENKTVFCDMAEALVKWQREDGFWNCNIMDDTDFGGPETSATVLISFALAKGINIGVIDKETYLPYILKAYEGMCEIALNEEGRLGYVQGVAGWPGPVYPETAVDYACGAFTRLSEELLKLI
jgi:rhamnogalacturonyl hydrolase YesR